MSFRAPKYRDFLDPREVPKGYRQSLIEPEISDKDFRTALSEAYWLMNLAIDEQTAARMRRQHRTGVRGHCTKAEITAGEMVSRRRSELLYLLAGLLGHHLPADNAMAREIARVLCRAAEMRAQNAQGSARSKQGGQIQGIGFPVSFPRKNAAKGKR